MGSDVDENETQTPRKRALNTPPTGSARFHGGTSATLAEVQYERLRAAIVSMEMLPGTAIAEKKIAEDQGISRTPIREAILRLTKEKLVEVVPKSGTFVARIPISALPESLIARRALEGMTARSAARYAQPSQVLQLRALVERMRELSEQGNTREFHHVDEEFHEMIAAAGRLPGLWALVQQVKLQVDRFRQLTLPETGRMAMVGDEHAAIVDAIEQKDEDGACEKLQAHLAGLQLHIAYAVESHPEYFIHDVDLDDIPQI